MLKKVVDFLKLLLTLTNGIKTCEVLLIVENFKNALKTQIVKIADKKYTSIMLVENYHYMLRFFATLSDVGLSVDNAKFLAFEMEFNELYYKYQRSYVEEVFDYQFHDVNVYFNEQHN